MNYSFLFTFLRNQYFADAHNVTCSVSLAFGLNWASNMNVGLGSGSCFKMRPVYNSGCSDSISHIDFEYKIFL